LAEEDSLQDIEKNL